MIGRLIVGKALFEWNRKHMLAQSYRLRRKYTRVHQPRLLRDQRPEVHFRENVALEIDARRYLRQFQPVPRQAKYTAFGDIEHGPTRPTRNIPAKSHMFDLGHEFSDVAVTQNLQ